MAETLYWMHRNTICTVITVDLKSNSVSFENKVDEPLLCAFGKEESPVNIKELYKLFDTRISPPRSYEDDYIYENIGLYEDVPSIEHLLELTHGVLVDDFFWFWHIKEDNPLPDYLELRKSFGLADVDGTESIGNLKQHKFTRYEIYNIQSLITRASQPKWIYKGWFIKKDFWGYEAITEALTSLLSNYVKNIKSIDYILLPRIDKRGVCASKIYTDTNDCEYVSLWNILSLGDYINDLPKDYKKLPEFLAEVIHRETGIDKKKWMNYFYKLLLWDATILNTDRHYNNIAVKRLNTGKYDVVDIYDNGLSLFSGTKDHLEHGIQVRIFGDTVSDYINIVKGKAILKIDILGFIEELNKIKEFYCINKGKYATEFENASTILLARLIATEGITWQRTDEEQSEWVDKKQYSKFVSIINKLETKVSRHKKESLEDLAYGRHQTE